MLEQIEANINGLLDIYDIAIKNAKTTKDVDKEASFNDEASKVVECIEHEMSKLKNLSSFEREIVVTISHH